ncbi:cilia- and flagella-associated protein 57 isoform X6 [Notamacropus eugenii]|uniref:cilia- and flagella-associated protein 57 isoform X6 n=1 Tax=Notamacropus eugenii TaxID=9315 RepID=UPI003B66EC32
MSTVVAQAQHIFGLRGRVANNLFFFDEQIIIFPCGNHCVKYNVDQKWQKFIPGSEKSQGMLALAISPNRRYLAISETVQDKATITIYELSSVPCRKRKVLSNFDFTVQKFVSMAFSPDSKYLVAQTGPPESNLIYWMWEKQKVMAIIRTDTQNNPIYQVSFNPQDNTQICVTGNGVFKLFRYAEGALKQTNFQRGEPQNYLSHTWISEDRIIVGTDTGKLFLFESGDQRWETSIVCKEATSETSKKLEVVQESESLIEFPAPSSPDMSSEQLFVEKNESQNLMPQVSAIAPYSKGFACSAGLGRVLLYEKMEEKDAYRESREIRIKSVVWNLDDSKLISCGTDGAVYEWNLSSGKRETECVLKSCSYNCVGISPDSKIIFAVGSDQTLKEIADSSVLREVSAFDVTYTAVVISHSGRMVFVGTSMGTIRSMKYPLPLHKEFNEYQAHAGPVTKMAITFDDQFLLTSAEDGCLITWKVYDKDGRGVKREREVGFAEEVLVTKTDMEEKAQIMLELKTRVEELKMENEYQLRLKDMNYTEKIKELTDKFIQEMESLKTKNQVLRTEKEKQEASHNNYVEDLLEKQSRELQDIECCNNQKLLLEYEKYQELQLKSQRMQEEYEKQLRDNEETKSQALEELTEYYEAKLHEKASLLEEAQDDARQQLREFEETKKQIEEDEDREIQDIKTKYEKKLRDEKEANLRLKGETGIMRKKFSSLQKEIEERSTDIEALKGEQMKLQGVIKALEKDIQGLKREIQERDETIQDKERRIYDLKKKNQELEKFKFVLDYKIKELKKQIEPRENEIKAMKEQIQEMEAELERFHKQNTQLELNITELWQKLRATDQEMRRERQKERDMEALVKRFKIDLHNCVGYIQEPRQLKEKIRALFDKYVQQADMVEIVGVDTDLQQEYVRQREHLERNLATLKKKVVKENELHRSDNVRIMQENVSLIKEINELRRELKITRTQVHDLESGLRLTKKLRHSEVPETAPNLEKPTTIGILRLNEEEETERIIEMQRLEIRRLRDHIHEQEQVPGLHPVGKLPSLEMNDRSPDSAGN